jgi:hypothetical protein
MRREELQKLILNPNRQPRRHAAYVRNALRVAVVKRDVNARATVYFVQKRHNAHIRDKNIKTAHVVFGDQPGNGHILPKRTHYTGYIEPLAGRNGVRLRVEARQAKLKAVDPVRNVNGGVKKCAKNQRNSLFWSFLW